MHYTVVCTWKYKTGFTDAPGVAEQRIWRGDYKSFYKVIIEVIIDIIIDR